MPKLNKFNGRNALCDITIYDCGYPSLLLWLGVRIDSVYVNCFGRNSQSFMTHKLNVDIHSQQSQ